MVTVDTDDERHETSIDETTGLTQTTDLESISTASSGSSIMTKVPPKRLKLLKRYARTNLEEERVPHGRGSSGFAAVQMTIDSEFGETIDQRSSPPLPDSPTSSPAVLPKPKELIPTSIIIQQPSITGNSPEREDFSEDSRDLTIPSVNYENYDKREENMRLLEVATTLTQDQLEELDHRYAPTHHVRSQSVRPRQRPNLLSLPQTRTRVASMPNTGAEEHYYRLRHFSIAGRSVVNKGDSLRARKPRSRESVASQESSRGDKTSRQSSSDIEAPASPQSYRVVMLGSSDVGKSSLINQFMTSEYLLTYDNSIDDDSGEKSVSVMLDGEESEMTFVDPPSSEMSPTTTLTRYKDTAHAYCVVFSTADLASFSAAEEILQKLWTEDERLKGKTLILIGNKTDLVRSRVVSSQDGKRLARAYGCRYTETSVGFDHNVDETLVGLLSRIRSATAPPTLRRDGSVCSSPKDPSPFCLRRGVGGSASLRIKGVLERVWGKRNASKSCDDLHVL